MPPRPKLSQRATKALMKRIEERLPRAELAEVLRLVDDPRAEAFINDMMNPLDRVQASRTLTTIARAHGVSGMELVNWIRKSFIDTGIIVAAQRIPQIMSDIADDALNRTETCWVCDGEGTIVAKPATPEHDEVRQKCAECRGTGQLVIKGDIENRKLALETTGLIQRRSGAYVNVPISFGGAPVDSFESLVSRAGDIIDGTATPVPALPSGDASEEP